MTIELFYIIDNTFFHWFTLTLGDWFCMWIESFKWYDIRSASIGIRFGNKEYKKYW